MRTRHLPLGTIALATSASLFALVASGCNKQPNTNAIEAPTVAPPIAALPLSAQTGPVAPAPAALPAPAAIIPYAPPPPRQGYQYIDNAYSMGQAFADTPPDYAVDYQGTRPWIWRARNGAYRIVERLPEGERDYYYEPGQDQPFLVRGPEYTYAYQGGDLAEVYGPDGAELDRAEAARRADEASRYLGRARELYRAAQYDQRQSAYASEWASRRNQLLSEQSSWGAGQSRNADWRTWHDQHAADEQRQWREEQVQRTAYATAIGAVTSSSGPSTDPRQLATRQAAYFSNWKDQHGPGQQTSKQGTTPTPSAPLSPTVAPPPAQVAQKTAVPALPPAKSRSIAQTQAQDASAAATQAKLAQAKSAEAARTQQSAATAAAGQAKEAQAKASEAAQARQLAVQAKQNSAAAAAARAAQANQAQQAAAEAKQHQAAAAQAKSAEEARAQQLKAQTQQHEAAAAQAKAAQAAHAQQMAAQAAAANAKEAQAKSAQAQHAQQLAGEAKQREAAAAQTKNAEAQHAQQMAAQASQHQAAAAQAKASDGQHGPPQGQPGKGGDHAKAQANSPKANPPAKDHRPDQQQ